MRQGKCPYSSLLSRGNNDLYTDGQNTRQTVTSTIDKQVNYCHSTYHPVLIIISLYVYLSH